MIVYPEGRIGNDSANHYRYHLRRLITKYNNCDFIIINMDNVPSISSNGIAVLVFMAKELINNDRSLSICCPSHLVKQILSILNINNIARYPTEENAIRTLLTEAVSHEAASGY